MDDELEHFKRAADLTEVAAGLGYPAHARAARDCRERFHAASND